VPAAYQSITTNHTCDHSHDYETFMQELEEDPELRAGLNLYKGMQSRL
jgi:hypothetical protein